MGGQRDAVRTFTLERSLELIRAGSPFIGDRISVNSDRHTAGIGCRPINGRTVTRIAGIGIRGEGINIRDHLILSVLTGISA